MDSITWHISPSATFAYRQFAEPAGWVRAGSHWQQLTETGLPERLLPQGVRSPHELPPHVWVDFLVEHGMEALDTNLDRRLPRPIRDQIQNELALRSSSLKHHWMTRGPGIMAQIESVFPLSELMLIDLYPVLPQTPSGRPFAPILVGVNQAATFLPAALYDTNPFAPELLKIVFAVTYSALKTQPEVLSGSVAPERIQYAAARLATALGQPVDLGNGDRPTFDTLVQHLPIAVRTDWCDALWHACNYTNEPRYLALACIDWVLDRQQFGKN